MLPMPMRPAIDTANAWNEDTPASDFSPRTVSRHISAKPRTCRKRVRRLNHSAAPRHMKMSALLQMMSLTNWTMDSTYFPGWSDGDGCRCQEAAILPRFSMDVHLNGVDAGLAPHEVHRHRACLEQGITGKASCGASPASTVPANAGTRHGAIRHARPPRAFPVPVWPARWPRFPASG